MLLSLRPDHLAITESSQSGNSEAHSHLFFFLQRVKKREEKRGQERKKRRKEEGRGEADAEAGLWELPKERELPGAGAAQANSRESAH